MGVYQIEYVRICRDLVREIADFLAPAWGVIRLAVVQYGMVILVTLGCASAHSNEPSGLTFDDHLDVLSKWLARNPDDLKVGDELREHCRNHNQIPACITQLEALVERHPLNKSIRYQLALAYVDNVPGHSLYKQGWYSTRSQDQVSAVIKNHPADWAAYYIRGLNNIYWPTSFRRIPRAIDDLKKCIEISSGTPSGLHRPFFGLAYIALGDAYVKYGDIESARKTYELGLALYSSPQMKNRLALSDLDLSNFVKTYRNADTAVDTEIFFLIDGGEQKL